MIIYPAVDIKNGKCVRLEKGDMNKATKYGEPYKMAKQWQSLGAEYIHLVDLDSAFTGGFKNYDAVSKILDNINIPVQLGGGIRTMEDIDERLRKLNIDRVIIGTAAVKNPDLVKQAVSKYPGRIVVGIDAKDGKAAIEGWDGETGIDAVTLALSMKEIGIDTIIYTDIAKDGMLSGPNLEATKEMVQKTGMNIIGSGGMSCQTDVINIKKTGVSGVIVGRALYTKDIDLKEAMSI
jgi:phosphoribosylformimino-5-aminoimidazole carboxamide ribotide isomerase